MNTQIITEPLCHLVAWDVYSKARQPGLQPRRMNVDFPEWMIEAMDKEAKRLGVTRQSIIKVWIAERLEKAQAH
ncbi:type II toxin-antitoxin system BrnA family antitoxin [Acidithiobacillus sp. AC3]